MEKSAGNGDGIGSRFFNILNTSTATSGAKGIKPLMQVSSTGSLSSLDGIATNTEPIRVRRGYSRSQQPKVVEAGENAVFNVEMREVGRVVLELGGPVSEGYLVVGDQLRPLPVGSTLDKANGVFYWQPGPGFMGQYEIVFIASENVGAQELKKVKIRIKPKFGGKERPAPKK